MSPAGERASAGDGMFRILAVIIIPITACPGKGRDA
jgi:hypothetical protein